MQIVAESLAADARDRQRVASIVALNARIKADSTAAASEGRKFATTVATLRELIADNADAKAALDELEATHKREVQSLQFALAHARQIITQDSIGIRDRDRQLAALRSDLTDAITRADTYERQANPGWVKRVIDSPGTHAIAALVGYVAGSR